MSADEYPTFERPVHVNDDGLIACNAIRFGTLGYQRCWLNEGHDGPHKSQDMETYGPASVEADR